MKIYTITFYSGYTSEGNTNVFLNKEESLNAYSKEAKEQLEDYEEAINSDNAEPESIEKVDYEKHKEVSGDNGEVYTRLEWREHDVL